MTWVTLLMAEILHHLGCKKPCKQWDKLPITGAGFQPSTAVIWMKASILVIQGLFICFLLLDNGLLEIC